VPHKSVRDTLDLYLLLKMSVLSLLVFSELEYLSTVGAIAMVVLTKDNINNCQIFDLSLVVLLISNLGFSLLASLRPPSPLASLIPSQPPKYRDQAPVLSKCPTGDEQAAKEVAAHNQ